MRCKTQQETPGAWPASRKRGRLRVLVAPVSRERDGGALRCAERNDRQRFGSQGPGRDRIRLIAAQNEGAFRKESALTFGMPNLPRRSRVEITVFCLRSVWLAASSPRLPRRVRRDSALLSRRRGSARSAASAIARSDLRPRLFAGLSSGRAKTGRGKRRLYSLRSVQAPPIWRTMRPCCANGTSTPVKTLSAGPKMPRCI
jgi:hypothetical protein